MEQPNNKEPVAPKVEGFDFAELWNDELDPGFTKYIPWITLVINVIVLIVLIFKK